MTLNQRLKQELHNSFVRIADIQYQLDTGKIKDILGRDKAIKNEQLRIMAILSSIIKNYIKSN